MHRREMIAAMAAAGLGLLSPQEAEAAHVQSWSQIQMILPKEPALPDTQAQRRDYEYRLSRAVLDLAQDTYGQGNLPVWGTPLSKIDLEKRVINIVYWVMRSVPQQARVYPVDPAWIMAQMMEESYFYEFAVSWAFAVGICQFISSTAQAVGMICPENSPLGKDAVSRAELASARDRMSELRRKRRELIRQDPDLFRNPEAKMKGILQTLAAGETYSQPQKDLSRLEQMQRLNEAISEARSGYKTYLEANYQGRSIFDSRDLQFLTRFDQRVTYKKPIQGMVRIMAENLRARQGNMLAATAAYNAGLSRTISRRKLYESYGQLPAFRETVAYISRIVVNHHEIVSRM